MELDKAQIKDHKSFPLKQLVQETQRYPVQQHMTSTQLGKTYKRSRNQKKKTRFAGLFFLTGLRPVLPFGQCSPSKSDILH